MNAALEFIKIRGDPEVAAYQLLPEGAHTSHGESRDPSWLFFKEESSPTTNHTSSDAEDDLEPAQKRRRISREAEQLTGIDLEDVLGDASISTSSRPDHPIEPPHNTVQTIRDPKTSSVFIVDVFKHPRPGKLACM